MYEIIVCNYTKTCTIIQTRLFIYIAVSRLIIITTGIPTHIYNAIKNDQREN